MEKEYQIVDDKSTTYTAELEVLSAMPRGTGVHPKIYATACLGAEAGLNEDQIFADIRAMRGEDTTDREIRDAARGAVRKLYSGFDGYPDASTDAERPAKAPPRSIDLNHIPAASTDDIEAVSPVPIPTEHAAQTTQFLKTLYKPDEFVYIGGRGAAVPGKNLLLLRNWLKKAQIHGEQIAANPLTGKPGPLKNQEGETYRGQSCIADFRFLVCEFDALKIEQQAGIARWMIQAGPVAAVFYSGGKSLHVLMKVSAVSHQQFDEIAARLSPHLGGLGVDLSCFTPERLTRLPGAYRKDKKQLQTLYYLNPEPTKSLDDFLTALEALPDQPPDCAPILFDSPAPPDIPAAILPNVLGKMAAAVARATQTAEAMPGTIGLAAVSACVAGKFEIGPTATGYAEPVNIYAGTVSPSGSRKTAVVDAMTAPLFQWERMVAEFMADDIRERAAQIAIHKRRAEKLERDAATGKDRATRAEAASQLQEHLRDAPDPIHAPQLITSDITGETLQNKLAENAGRLAIITDEGGIFENIAGLYSDGRANVDVYLKGHAGSPVRVDRQGRTAHIDRPALTFGLAIQPGVFQDLNPAARLRLRRNGLFARFICTFPPSNVGRRDVRAIYSVPDETAADYRSKLHALLNTPLPDRPERLALNTRAREQWLDFAQNIENRMAPGCDLENLTDWAGKLPGACLRVAALFHVIEHEPEDLTVNGVTMAAAVDFSARLVDHAKAVFTLLGDQSSSDAQTIYEWAVDQQAAEFTKTDVWRRFKGRFTGRAARMEAALHELEDRHIVTASIDTATGGKPAHVFKLHPSLLSE